MLQNQWRLVGLLAVAAIALVAYAAPRLGGSAAVTGTTSAERVESINRLGREQGAAAKLAELASNDGDVAVRRTAIAALATYRRVEDRGIFEKALTHEDASVRAVAAQAVGGYGVESVAVLTAIAKDPDSQVRLGVVTGLCQTGRGPGLATLLTMMAQDRDPAVRFQALKAIEAVSNVKYLEVPDPRDEKRWAALVQKVSGNSWVREQLAKEGRIGGKP